MLVVCSSAACASTSSSTTATSEPTTETTDTAPTTSDPDPTSTPPPASGTASVKANPDEESREITVGECKTIAGKFRENTISDEMAKLSPKLTDAQRETARGRIEEAADQLGQRWEKGCVADLLGKAVAEKSLKCAMASKTVAALDACLSGQSP